MIGTAALLLFVSAFAAGLSALRLSAGETFRQVGLIFSGAYIFAITAVHLLPELFSETETPFRAGILLMAGFFFQYFFERPGTGGHGAFGSRSFFIGLCVHGLTEGLLLARPDYGHGHEGGSQSLLLGVILHTIPASAALVSVVLSQTGKRRQAILALFIFSIAGPLGIFAGYGLTESHLFSEALLGDVHALVCGTFLWVATSVFFDAPREKVRNTAAYLALIAGASAAVLTEIYA